MKSARKIIAGLSIIGFLAVIVGAPSTPLSLRARTTASGMAEFDLKTNGRFDPLCVSRLEFSKDKKFTNEKIYKFTVGSATFTYGSIDFKLPGTPFNEYGAQIKEIYARQIVDCSEAEVPNVSVGSAQVLKLSKLSSRSKIPEEKFFSSLVGKTLSAALRKQRSKEFINVTVPNISSRLAPEIISDLSPKTFTDKQDIILRVNTSGSKTIKHEWYMTAPSGGSAKKVKGTLGLEVLSDPLGATLIIRADIINTKKYDGYSVKVNAHNKFGSAVSESIVLSVKDSSELPTATPTKGPIVTPTLEVTATPEATATPRLTVTVKATLTPTKTSTPTRTPTKTFTGTVATNTPSRTPTKTATSTNTSVVVTNTPTRTATKTATPTNTQVVATNTPTRTATPRNDTLVSDSGWSKNLAFEDQSADIKKLNVSFDMKPNGSSIDSVTGVSNGTASSYGALAAIVRFNPSGSVIDAYDGGGYKADQTVTYQANGTYRVRMEVDIEAKTYSVFVGDVKIANNYAFRTSVNKLTHLNVHADSATSGSHTVSNITVEQIGAGPVNGECGSANGGYSTQVPSSNLCSKGTASSVTTSGNNYLWTCSGRNGGSNASCLSHYDNRPVNGECGSANGGKFRNIPTSNLCSVGSATEVSRSGDNYYWTCSGINSGSSANCSAEHDDSVLTQPVRVPNFGPNGSHWPGQQNEGEPENPNRIKTPFMYDKGIKNQIHVDAPISWAKIDAALRSVTKEMADQGTVIWVAPGDLAGMGSRGANSKSTPVLNDIDGETWNQRVLVAPRDGYGTVTWKNGTRIYRVRGVAFAGFIAEGGISFAANSRSALAWINNKGYLGVNGHKPFWTHSVEIVEVVRNVAAQSDVDSANVYNIDGNATGGGVGDFYFDGNYFAPVFTDTDEHSDTLQFAKWSPYDDSMQGYGNIVIRDTAIFASTDCALQIGNVGVGTDIRTGREFEFGLKLEKTYIASGHTSASRYRPSDFVRRNTSPAHNGIDGSGKNLFAKDSIFIGGDTINDKDTSTPWDTVENSLASDNFRGATPIHGRFTFLEDVDYDTVYTENMPRIPDDTYLTEHWFTKWQTNGTPTVTPTRTRTATATNTSIFTNTPTRTPTNTSIVTNTPTATRTPTSTNTVSGPTFTPTRTPTASPTGATVDCTRLQSNAEYQNCQIPSKKAAFTAAFDVIPGSSGINGLIGLSAESVTAQNHSQVSSLIRFGTNSSIDIHNGTTYIPSGITYSAGGTYRLLLTVYASSNSFTVAIKTPGSAEFTAISGSFGFRRAINVNDLNPPNSINYLSHVLISGSSQTINNTVISDITTTDAILRVRKSGSGSGIVAGSQLTGGISCGSDCTEYRFPKSSDTKINLVASPGSSSAFSGWSGNCSGKTICTAVLDSDKEITANFASGSAGTAYQESSGLLVMEAENTTSSLGSWNRIIPGNSNYVEGATNNAHLEFTGNATDGGNASSPLTYTFKINQSGYYRIILRARKRLNCDPASSGCRTDLSNDCYIKVNGASYSAGPNAGNLEGQDAPYSILTNYNKLYDGSHNSWGWSQLLDVEAGDQYPVYNFNAGSTYTLTIAGRSKQYNFDRIIFHHFDVPATTAKDPSVAESTKVEGGSTMITPTPTATPTQPSVSGCAVEGGSSVMDKVTVKCTGPALNEATGTNPFYDYRMDVTFSKGSKSFVVPGYFAADGNAANTSATSGNQFHALFRPDETGIWNYSVSFRTGSQVAIGGSGTATGFNGANGSFNVGNGPNPALGAMANGRLIDLNNGYLGTHINNKVLLKMGPGTPENFLSFSGFDAAHSSKSTDYSAHAGQDWQSDPVSWKSGEARGIIGAINYLSSVGSNALYLMFNNVDGDNSDVSPHIGTYGDPVTDRYDVSKLAQWYIVLEHANKKGIILNLFFHDDDSDNKSLLGNADSALRKLYIREMIARFGSLPLIQWNISEEYDKGWSSNNVKQVASIITSVNPFKTPISVHTQNITPSENSDNLLNKLLAETWHSPISLQIESTDPTTIGTHTEQWISNSLGIAGKRFPISVDEPKSFSLSGNPDNSEKMAYYLIFSGGWGLQMYEGTSIQDAAVSNFHVADETWKRLGFARQFAETYLPLGSMESADSIDSGASGSPQVFRSLDKTVHAVYYTDGSNPGSLNFGTSANRTLKWFNPRTGSFEGDTASLTGSNASLPDAPSNKSWVAFIKNN